MTHASGDPKPVPVGDLRGGIWAGRDPYAGAILVDGSGDGSLEDWGRWPARIAGCGATVLAHDKPGCGPSPGDWRQQTLDDRARETLTAVDVLRARTTGPVGLVGFSQGGWVALLAAAHAPSRVDFVVTISGPGVGPARQERARIARELATLDTRADGLAWVDERARRLASGEDPAAVLRAQRELAGRPWYSAVTASFDTEADLRFLGSLLTFDPAEVLPSVHCPVLALFGAADPLVPVVASVQAYLTHLPTLPGIAVLPGADHGLFTAAPDPGVDRDSQLAPGFLPLLTGFLTRPAGRAPEPTSAG